MWLGRFHFIFAQKRRHISAIPHLNWTTFCSHGSLFTFEVPNLIKIPQLYMKAWNNTRTYGYTNVHRFISACKKYLEESFKAVNLQRWCPSELRESFGTAYREGDEDGASPESWESDSSGLPNCSKNIPASCHHILHQQSKSTQHLTDS